MHDDKPLLLLQQTYAALIASAHGLQAQGDKYVEVLTSRQLMVLTVIARMADEPVTINAVAREMGTTKQSMRQLIAKLETDGIVLLQQNPHDRRAVSLIVTERGRNLLQANGDKNVHFLQHAFDGLTREETERLQELLAKLRRDDGDGQARSALNADAAPDRRTTHDHTAV
ncbi:MarR family winged helix-turn-helix transcriptional regulator [Paenibacillus methanolicus]|uniref:DNA-binding MarR family transcriptional regulator n=1 Tax=Paenibacillus methanolicus TaxID=582686 RepID=A0A5S5C5H3_9BACL|nr:MarR family transcriptional regulator [Paenibacillus methanolicus]TYP74681.1 DNA-binding MarR family transcriptional regulator [Paenibacillus methanolicus]